MVGQSYLDKTVFTLRASPFEWRLQEKLEWGELE